MARKTQRGLSPETKEKQNVIKRIEKIKKGAKQGKVKSVLLDCQKKISNIKVKKI